jgi:ankyrin repeat protein
MDPALHKAAVQGSAASLKKLVAGRPDILGSKTPQKNTALHIAAELGHAGFAKEVLSVKGELLVSKNADGDTPLHVAAFNGKLAVVKVLLAAGASVNARDNEGWTPLSQARDQGYPDVVECLKSYGATR